MTIPAGDVVYFYSPVNVKIERFEAYFAIAYNVVNSGFSAVRTTAVASNWFAAFPRRSGVN
jgi:hypothetical protein